MKNEVLRLILIGVGWVSIVCALLGLFLPLVPSVPFLLLAVFCFSRSSEKFHHWLVEHRHFGPLLKDYLVHGGISVRAKAAAICAVWISFPVSAFWLVQSSWAQVLLLAIAAGVTVCLVLIPTLPASLKRKG
ncbi:MULTISPECIES: YbaN family protein [Geobacteraceae]|uniref:Membrane protein n=1 Tax=Geoanaerobacter pelophilus TaxID=60036 RepID=A0ABQ0MIN0_9BACT|nr:MULTISPECIES: YbaN family protein [Geobacteraceae]GAW66940.1 membrane protein [Geoanaerobacter pelophilus]